MSNLLVDQRDQRFVLHEMLEIEELFKTSLYGHLTEDFIDSSLSAALKLAEKEFYPIMAEADREGCRVENGEVRAPKCYHRLKEHYDSGKWSSAHIPLKDGGLGFPMSLWAPVFECFTHNLGFAWNWSSPFTGLTAIVEFGSEEQKKRYLPNLVSGKWGSALACTEHQAGSDLSMQSAVAVKQADGSYRLKGVKPTVTVGDSDLFENMVLCVLARVDKDPANATGLSLFLVPKYVVNDDGSLGARNDYLVTGVERKLGFRASPTVSLNFGENGDCYAELLGERGHAMPMALQLLKNGDFANAMIATGIASAAYLHSLDHAKKRIQGAHISEATNPDAKPVAIINHPFVRNLLLWMKSHVEGMRALNYYSCLCLDKAKSLKDAAESEKWSGLKDILLPVCRLYSADRGFKVVEKAIQVHGRNGYFSDYPVQQFMRDILPLAWWELGAGVHSLIYVAQTLGQRDGRDFANLIVEMKRSIGQYQEVEGVKDLAEDVHRRVDLMAELGAYLAGCAKNGKVLTPISNGLQIMHLVGEICVGWLLFRQAAISSGKLGEIFRANSIDAADFGARNLFLGQNKEAAFHEGKVHSARYFIKNVLPGSDAVAAAIRSEDLSLMAIHEEGF
ncbi:MAG: acyl-CoA dehydrogenase [Syntrophobacteraceae bacterium]|nr:acyl-CoA dehydrogenase [Syntrophobacteraceae bacterium]